MRLRFPLIFIALIASGCPFQTYDGMEALNPPEAFPTLDPPESAPAATVATGTITLPTVPMESISWLPAPFAMDDVDRGYPFERADRSRIQWSTPKAEDREWKTVVLENEYLRVTLLPELGGRLFEAIFKPTGRQVFFREKELKPFGLWNTGKEWMFATGGLRFEFPTWGHDPNTERPWTPTLRTYPNGTAAAAFERVDERTGLLARVHVSLDPGRAWIRLNMELGNATDFPRPAAFWTITGMRGTKGVEFIVPVERMIEHGGDDTFAWPVARGVDWTCFRDWPDMQSFFTLDWKSDFSGLYDHLDDSGIVRFASHRDTPGLKLWGAPGWGDRYYVSIYGGLTQTMEEQITLAPGQFRRWEETWYPLAGTKGLTFANREIALSLHRKGSQIVLGIQPTRTFAGASIRVTQGGETLFEKAADLSPASALVEGIPLKGDAGILVRIIRDDGRVLTERTFQPKEIRKAFE